jgi:Tol biopolymer transport system component
LTIAGEIWVLDLASGSLTPVAHEKSIGGAPIWTPDGKRLLYVSSGTLRTGQLISAPADGSGSPSVLVSDGIAHFPASVCSDGKVAMGYRSRAAAAGPPYHLWVMPLAAGVSRNEKPQTFLESQYSTAGGQFSPDCRWISYQSGESGVTAVYVTPYPGPGGRIQISPEFGATARWARNGRELFYRSSKSPEDNQRMMAVDIQTSPDFRIVRTRTLFEIPWPKYSADYDVAPDGRFLMIKRDGRNQEAQPNELHVLLNWVEELRRRVPMPK